MYIKQMSTNMSNFCLMKDQQAAFVANMFSPKGWPKHLPRGF